MRSKKLEDQENQENQGIDPQTQAWRVKGFGSVKIPKMPDNRLRRELIQMAILLGACGLFFGFAFGVQYAVCYQKNPDTSFKECFILDYKSPQKNR